MDRFVDYYGFCGAGQDAQSKEFTVHYVKSLQNIIKTGGNADAIEGLGMELRRDLDPLFIRRMKKMWPSPCHRKQFQGKGNHAACTKAGI